MNAILKHFFECKQKQVEGVTHLANSIGVEESSVSRSLNLLIDVKYIKEDTKWQREKGKKQFEKALFVTDKGQLAAVVMLCIRFDQLVEYSRKYGASYVYNWEPIFKSIFSDEKKREIYFKNTCEYALRNNLFDEYGNIRTKFTVEEQQNMQLAQL
jgi:hypothetical protein